MIPAKTDCLCFIAKYLIQNYHLKLLMRNRHIDPKRKHTIAAASRLLTSASVVYQAPASKPSHRYLDRGARLLLDT